MTKLVDGLGLAKLVEGGWGWPKLVDGGWGGRS